ncbi:MAG TPA: hypothetical protein VFU14_20370 [Acidimicrobiales bacterium]|nr:hypothetical protein [Acidimicrobiales bacterium]
MKASVGDRIRYRPYGGHPVRTSSVVRVCGSTVWVEPPTPGHQPPEVQVLAHEVVEVLAPALFDGGGAR